MSPDNPHPGPGPTGSNPTGTVPLERALSKLGIASRKQARGLIVAGRVGVHGQPVLNPLAAVTPETAAMGHPVFVLVRTAIGGLELGDMEPGEYRKLSVEEVAKLLGDKQ